MKQPAVGDPLRSWPGTSARRPEQLAPEDFLDLTGQIFGFEPEDPAASGTAVWRTKQPREAREGEA